MFRSKLAIGERENNQNSVSILVLVDVSLEVFCLVPEPHPEEVSILVLVDVSLEVMRLPPLRSTGRSFNPCSRGCFARRRNFMSGNQLRWMFQSLFSWMFRSKVRREEHMIFGNGFQSLFSWMFRSKGIACSVVDRFDIVSILVLVDVSLEVPVVAFVDAGFLCFNPCSRGCFARSTYSATVTGTSTGFNPCSRGCFARRLHQPERILPGHVSILVLVDVSLEDLPGIGMPRPLQFQSLFSWMFRSKISFGNFFRRILGFNPCSRGCFARRGICSPSGNHRRAEFQSLFSWMFRSKISSGQGAYSGMRVSILVLVDVSLEEAFLERDR